MLKCRNDITKEGERERTGKFNNADYLVKYVLSDLHEGSAACEKCRKGNGLYEGCVTLDKMNQGCATCHYQNAAGSCSLNGKLS